jgi:hypothetical protein
MQRPTHGQLEQLSKDELIALVERLFDEHERLRSVVERLSARLNDVKRPPSTSRNSSLQPSRDAKSDAPVRKRKRCPGARPGHPRMPRPPVDNPTQVVVAPVERCRCGADLSGVQSQAVIRRKITELREAKPVVFEAQQHEVRCPCC